MTAANGDVHTGSAAIGADGLWSNARKLFVDDQPVCSEYVAYRGAIPMEDVTEVGNLDDVFMWIGPNFHLVQYPVRRGELYNQVVVFKSSEYRKEIQFTDEWGTPEEMDRVFEGTCSLVQTALSFIQRQKRWPMYDREPLENWTKGRITLTGDAAHPMLQYLAQGACQAFEDAAYLADMVEQHDEDIKRHSRNTRKNVFLEQLMSKKMHGSGEKSFMRLRRKRFCCVILSWRTEHQEILILSINSMVTIKQSYKSSNIF